MSNIITGYARLSHHTLSTSGLTFSIPPSEDFTLGGSMSWTQTDLLESEIGVNEGDGTAFIRIGNEIRQFNFTTQSTPLQTRLTDNLDGIIDTIEVDPSGSYFGTGIRSSEGPTYSSIVFDPNNITIHSGNGTGLTYDDDYTGTFIANSLVTKGYVDSHIGGIVITSIDRTSLINLRDTNSLAPGNIYEINDLADSTIYLNAISTNVLSTFGTRVQETVDHNCYIGLSASGVYDWTGTVAMYTPYTTGNIVIWGSRLWELSATSSVGGMSEVIDDYNLDNTIWNELYVSPLYKLKSFEVEYDIDLNRIGEQRDDQGNVVRYSFDVDEDFSLITDWGYKYMTNNETCGIFNNMMNSNPISYNRVSRQIKKNKCFGDGMENNTMSIWIYGNQVDTIRNNDGVTIMNNFANQIAENNVSDIHSNGSEIITISQISSNVGTLIDHNQTGAITHNMVGNIRYNTEDINVITENVCYQLNNNRNIGEISKNVVGNISFNYNTGDIKENTGGPITDNSNGGNIQNNHTLIGIYGNSFPGSIYENDCLSINNNI